MQELGRLQWVTCRKLLFQGIHRMYPGSWQSLGGDAAVKIKILREQYGKSPNDLWRLVNLKFRK